MERASGAHVISGCLGALLDLEGADVGIDVACLTRPVGEQADESRRLRRRLGGLFSRHKTARLMP